MVFGASAIPESLCLRKLMGTIYIFVYRKSSICCCSKATDVLSRDDILRNFGDDDLWQEAKMDEVNAYLRGCKGLNMPAAMMHALRV